MPTASASAQQCQQPPVDVIETGRPNILRFVGPAVGFSRLLFVHDITLSNINLSNCREVEISSHLKAHIRY